MFLGIIDFLFSDGVGESIYYYNKKDFYNEVFESLDVGRPISFFVYYDY